MKGTEVPNPRRSSACDCTCGLTRNQLPSCESFILAMHIVLFLSMQMQRPLASNLHPDSQLLWKMTNSRLVALQWCILANCCLLLSILQCHCLITASTCWNHPFKIWCFYTLNFRSFYFRISTLHARYMKICHYMVYRPDQYNFASTKPGSATVCTHCQL